jgi:hypothetical protein
VQMLAKVDALFERSPQPAMVPIESIRDALP